MFDSAEEFARECGVHSKTVVEWIKEGKLTAFKRKSRNERYRIPEYHKYKIRYLRPPYPKYYKWYTDTEIYIMQNNKDLSNAELAKILKRSENSVCIKRCRLRKEGYDV